MANHLEYYKSNIDNYTKDVSKLYKQLTTLSIARLLVFIATGVSVYFAFGNWQILIGIVVIGVIGFIYLLNKYTDLKHTYELKKVLVTINTEELQFTKGAFFDKSEGLQFQDANHNYALDIDLFGRGSFFQFINRTTNSEGSKTLANCLKANNTNAIVSRQEAIKDLANKSDWRQVFQANASLIKVDTKASTILSFLKMHKSFIPKYFKLVPLIISALSLIIIGLAVAQIIPAAIIGYWLFVGLFITGRYVKKTNTLSANTDRMRDTFRQYASLLSAIENESFTSNLLLAKQAKIKLEDKKASQILHELSKAMDALDNRNNLISAIFGNGYFLTDLKNAYRIEQWLENYKDKVEDWFEVVAFFDAYNSLGNYAFNHQQYIYPQIVDKQSDTKVTQLGHPLLKTEKRVDNDFEIKNQQFFIITGANMAGKSTFLRTVSLHIVMANVGLPVCAVSSVYSPVKLITSMRTSDSLTDDSSYFFSELTRLKYIVDAIKQDNYFIILDEILKGTNSTDKAIGSRKFVEKLVASHATGIIATHDLSLCEIEKHLEEVKNYYFDAQIINDELYFDYTFKKGICQNMNASFLLKKMEIV
ncbi:DNA mismatch repair protein MutS [Olleya sp. UBA1516]|uniref:MutS-related protein n=1 Tax=Olleya sp. UBA1516 TaxID=1947013 RepID=UPI0025D0AB97|nr:DNA mismatch repair protein MutS [Olleya sp. UBA1516]|tara:strand:- start:31083 stop:32852 length:1770 start_codon:yes stop_codon:yes gene_type:complete